MSRVTISIFSTSDPDSIEAIDCLGLVISSPEDVVSGITDRSGRYEANLPPGEYFLAIIDHTLSPTTGQGIPYLLDYPFTVLSLKDTFVKVEIDSSQIESESDIPRKLRVEAITFYRTLN
jgi:hypothetical protein